MAAEALVAEKPPHRIAQDASSAAPATDSTSAVDEYEALRAELLEISAEISQWRDPGIFDAFHEYVARAQPQIRSYATFRVFNWILRHTAMYNRWTVPNDRCQHLRFVYISDIAEACGLSKRTIYRANRNLEQLRLVLVDRSQPNGAGPKEGLRYTLLMRNAQWGTASKRGGGRPANEPISIQTRLQLAPTWLEDSLAAAGIVVEHELKPATELCQRLQTQEELEDEEMAAWIDHAARVTGPGRQRPIGYFRRTLEGLMRERDGHRLPPDPTVEQVVDRDPESEDDLELRIQRTEAIRGPIQRQDETDEELEARRQEWRPGMAGAPLKVVDG